MLRCKDKVVVVVARPDHWPAPALPARQNPGTIAMRVRRGIVFAQLVSAGAGGGGGGVNSQGGLAGEQRHVHRDKRRRVVGTVLATAVTGTPRTVRVDAGGADGTSAEAGIL